MSDAGLDAELARIGRRVRRWREERRWTLQELARRSGLATSTVHKVESAQMIPSVAVLLKLVRGLGRRPAELIHDEGAPVEVLHLRAAGRHPVGIEGRMRAERLSGDLFDPALETWRVTVHPGFTSGSERGAGGGGGGRDQLRGGRPGVSPRPRRQPALQGEPSSRLAQCLERSGPLPRHGQPAPTLPRGDAGARLRPLASRPPGSWDHPRPGIAASPAGQASRSRPAALRGGKPSSGSG